jgi:glycosyltransferase involved in cell wall biosynthesis
MTAMGNGTATGEVKAQLFMGWPKDRLLQISSGGKDNLMLPSLSEIGAYSSIPVSEDSAREAIVDFNPDVILYRIAPKVPWVHEFAMHVIKHWNRPLVTWLMDDWPEDLAKSGAEEWEILSKDLMSLLERSDLRLSICSAMSHAFQERYGISFRAFANGVNPVEWDCLRHHEGRRLLLRYSGGLATNMSLESVLRIARVVEALAEIGYDILLEISTHAWWHKQSNHLFSGFKHTTIETIRRTSGDYRAWLAEADIAVIAYNFDEDTLRYVQYSMANKMPECLASGAVVFAHGPRKIATIDYLASTEAAILVQEPSDQAVASALIALLENPAHRNALARQGRKIAFDRHNIIDLREDLRSAIASISPCKGLRDSKSDITRVTSGGLPMLAHHSKQLEESTQSWSFETRNIGRMGLREINKLLRNGSYQDAIVEYLWLWENFDDPGHPLAQIYSFNALYAARRLGMRSCMTLEELIENVKEGKIRSSDIR